LHEKVELERSKGTSIASLLLLFAPGATNDLTCLASPCYFADKSGMKPGEFPQNSIRIKAQEGQMLMEGCLAFFIADREIVRAYADITPCSGERLCTWPML
jgi:hypothetical protein